MSSPAERIDKAAAADRGPLRFVSAASLFDGHDAAINIIRRILQAHGAEVVHLGHNRSVADIVRAAIQEDADGIAVSSYQGGHNEYFRYMVDMLKAEGASHIRVVVGGGGTIAPHEVEELESYGVAKIYTPDDGLKLGLDGMIEDVFRRVRASPRPVFAGSAVGADDPVNLARAITLLEQGDEAAVARLRGHAAKTLNRPPVLGITGTGGAGKSSLTDEILIRIVRCFPDRRVAVVAMDPTRRRSGGALLGDRIRMNALANEQLFMRSLATRRQHLATSAVLADTVQLLKSAGFDLIVVETAGIGQSDTEIVDLVDVSMYVMTADYGAASQLEKIDMLDFADFIVLNKFEKRGAEDALRDVRKQVARNRKLFRTPPEELPVYPTIASQFNDAGVNALFGALCAKLHEQWGRLRPWRPEGLAPVELVDRHQFGEVQHVDLLELARRAEFRRHHVERDVGVWRDRRVALADPRSLDEDQVEPRGTHGLEHVGQRGGDLRARRARCERAHEDVRAVDRIHADAIAEQRSAGLAARRIDRDHRDAQPLVLIEAKAPHELVGERALARAAGAGDPERGHLAPGGRGMNFLPKLRIGSAELERRNDLGERAPVARDERRRILRRVLRRVEVALREHVVDHALQAHLLAVLGRVDPRNPALVQLADLRADDHATAATEHPHVLSAAAAQQLDHVLEILDVPALVGRDRDALRVLLQRRGDHLVDRAVMSQVDHLGARGLQDASHDVDRRVVTVEEARRGDEADLVLCLVGEAFRIGQVGHGVAPGSLRYVNVNVNPAQRPETRAVPVAPAQSR